MRKTTKHFKRTVKSLTHKPSTTPQYDRSTYSTIVCQNMIGDVNQKSINPKLTLHLKIASKCKLKHLNQTDTQLQLGLTANQASAKHMNICNALANQNPARFVFENITPSVAEI